MIFPTLIGPIKFEGNEYVRSGTSPVSLAVFPEKERQIESSKLEYAITNLSFQEVASLLDLNYYKNTRKIEKDSEADLINYMVSDRILQQSGTKYNITNLGAYTLAKVSADASIYVLGEFLYRQADAGEFLQFLQFAAGVLRLMEAQAVE